MLMVLESLRARMFETRDAAIPLPCVVREGMFVKCGLRGERFWCKVCNAGTDVLRVIIDNELLHSSWERGHELVLQHEHVLEVADATDRLAFLSLVSALGSERDAALAWRDLRVAEGVAAQPKPGARFVVPE